MLPPKRPQKDRIAILGVLSALALGAVSVVSFYVSSISVEIVPKADPIKDVETCRSQSVGIANKPAVLRGSTEVEHWRTFDQRFTFIPLKPKQISAPEIPGNRALSFKIEHGERNAYDIGISMVNQRKIVRGKTIQAEVWLRGESIETTSRPVVVFGKIQDNDDGFRRLNEEAFTPTAAFARYRMSAKAVRDYCPGALNFALHLATGPQTIDVGLGLLTVVDQR